MYVYFGDGCFVVGCCEIDVFQEREDLCYSQDLSCISVKYLEDVMRIFEMCPISEYGCRKEGCSI